MDQSTKMDRSATQRVVPAGAYPCSWIAVLDRSSGIVERFTWIAPQRNAPQVCQGVVTSATLPTLGLADNSWYNAIYWLFALLARGRGRKRGRGLNAE